MEWIKIEEGGRFPDDLEMVLFTDDKTIYKGFRNCSLLGDWNYWFSVTDVGVEDVTHWMPLPELPKYK